MVVTESQYKSYFQHVLNVVLEQPDNSPLSQALKQKGVDNILDFIALRWPVINTLTYPDGTGAQVAVTRQDKNLILLFIALVIHKGCIHEPMTDADWTSLTLDEFHTFRMNINLVTSILDDDKQFRFEEHISSILEDANYEPLEEEEVEMVFEEEEHPIEAVKMAFDDGKYPIDEEIEIVFEEGEFAPLFPVALESSTLVECSSLSGQKENLPAIDSSLDCPAGITLLIRTLSDDDPSKLQHDSCFLMPVNWNGELLIGDSSWMHSVAPAADAVADDDPLNHYSMLVPSHRKAVNNGKSE